MMGELFTFQFIRACIFILHRVPPTQLHMLSGQIVSLPLEFYLTATEADQAVIIVINTCHA